jgi:hypothetical protein
MSETVANPSTLYFRYVPIAGLKIELANIIFPGERDWEIVRGGHRIVLSKGQKVEDMETSRGMLQEWVDQWVMARSAENSP